MKYIFGLFWLIILGSCYSSAKFSDYCEKIYSEKFTGIWSQDSYDFITDPIQGNFAFTYLEDLYFNGKLYKNLNKRWRDYPGYNLSPDGSKFGFCNSLELFVNGTIVKNKCESNSISFANNNDIYYISQGSGSKYLFKNNNKIAEHGDIYFLKTSQDSSRFMYLGCDYNSGSTYTRYENLKTIKEKFVKNSSCKLPNLGGVKFSKKNDYAYDLMNEIGSEKEYYKIKTRNVYLNNKLFGTFDDLYYYGFTNNDEFYLIAKKGNKRKYYLNNFSINLSVPEGYKFQMFGFSNDFKSYFYVYTKKYEIQYNEKTHISGYNYYLVKDGKTSGPFDYIYSPTFSHDNQNFAFIGEKKIKNNPYDNYDEVFLNGKKLGKYNYITNKTLNFSPDNKLFFEYVKNTDKASFENSYLYIGGKNNKLSNTLIGNRYLKISPGTKKISFINNNTLYINGKKIFDDINVLAYNRHHSHNTLFLFLEKELENKEFKRNIYKCNLKSQYEILNKNCSFDAYTIDKCKGLDNERMKKLTSRMESLYEKEDYKIKIDAVYDKLYNMNIDKEFPEKKLYYYYILYSIENILYLENKKKELNKSMPGDFTIMF